MGKFLLWVAAVVVGSISNGFAKECVREFVLFTQPKTGSYLVGPLLAALSERGHHFAQASDFVSYPRPTKSEAEFRAYKNYRGYVPIYMHHLTIDKRKYIRILDRLRACDEFYACHTPYSLELDRLLQKRDCVVFFIVRDPRDYIVSGARFYGTVNQCIFPLKWYQSLSFDDQIMTMIKGTDWYNSSRWIVSSFKDWIYSPICCVLCFEDLVAPEASVKQLRQLRLIADHLGLDISDEELITTFRSIFGTGPTYSGKKMSWEEVFTEEHKQACKECIGDLLIELGYEKDYNW